MNCDCAESDIELEIITLHVPGYTNFLSIYSLLFPNKFQGKLLILSNKKMLLKVEDWDVEIEEMDGLALEDMNVVADAAPVQLLESQDKSKDQMTLTVRKYFPETWLWKCNSVRLVEHFFQMEMFSLRENIKHLAVRNLYNALAMVIAHIES